MQVCAWIQQRNLRDLILLERQVAVNWVDTGDLAGQPEPLVCSAPILNDGEASAALRERIAAGLGSLILPIFQAGNLAPALGAADSIRIEAGQANTLTWHDGSPVPVPARAGIATAIGTGRWLSAGGLCAALAWRPSTVAGTVVLCTAVCCKPHPAVEVQAQVALLHRLLDQLLTQTMITSKPAAQVTIEPVLLPANIDAYLAQEGNAGALVALAMVAEPDGDLANTVRTLFHCELPDDRLVALLEHLPTRDIEALRRALRRHGWRSYLRMVDRMALRNAHTAGLTQTERTSP